MLLNMIEKCIHKSALSIQEHKIYEYYPVYLRQLQRVMTGEIPHDQ